MRLLPGPVPILLSALLSCTGLMSSSLRAEPTVVHNGTDSYVAGTSTLPPLQAPGDVFAAGASVLLRGSAGGDVHSSGFSVEVEMPVSQDLYVAGGWVNVRAPVGSDLTGAGFALRTASEAVVGGNARLAAGSMVLDGPVRGALTAAAGDITLNAEVGGDVLLDAGAVHFGPDAKIGGHLTYMAPAEVTIPASVIPPDRVTFRPGAAGTAMHDWNEAWREGPRAMLPGLVTALWGVFLMLAFLVIVGAICLVAAPVLTERLRQSAVAAPGPSLLAGLLAMAMMVGLVPVSAMTLIGLPLVPVAVLLAAVMWLLGYLLAAYAIVHRLIAGLGSEDAGTLGRVVALAVVLLALGLLNFIPFLGWMVNIALMLFGLGAMARPVFARIGAVLPPAAPGPAAGPMHE